MRQCHQLEPSLPFGHIDSVTVSLSSRNHSSRITDHVISDELRMRVVQAEMFRSAVVSISCRFRCNEDTDSYLKQDTSVWTIPHKGSLFQALSVIEDDQKSGRATSGNSVKRNPLIARPLFRSSPLTAVVIRVKFPVC